MTKSGETEYGWVPIFDFNPMKDGMPPHFLLYLLNEQAGFVRRSKLMMATMWLQSQMAASICLAEDPDLRRRCKADHCKHLPKELGQATIRRLEALSSENLRRRFVDLFGEFMPDDLTTDVAGVTLMRDSLSHGYVSLFWQILGSEEIMWLPRTSAPKKKILEDAVGPLMQDSVLTLPLSEEGFKKEIERTCRVMDFIASVVKGWDIPYYAFA